MRRSETPAPVVLSALIMAALALSFALSGLAYGAPLRVIDVLRSMPVHRTDIDEPLKERALRLKRIADAVNHVSKTTDEAALLLTVGRYESGFARSVGKGDRTGDDGKAWGYWQSWDSDARGPVEVQAEYAIEHLRKAGNYCSARGHDWVSGAVSLYATGSTCEWDGASERVETWKSIVRRMR